MPRLPKAAVATLGIDIGKNTFHLVGLNKRGAHRAAPETLAPPTPSQACQPAPCLIGMEACVGAHFSRRLNDLGHDARLMPAKYVKAFLKGNKRHGKAFLALRRTCPSRWRKTSPIRRSVGLSSRASGPARPILPPRSPSTSA